MSEGHSTGAQHNVCAYPDGPCGFCDRANELIRRGEDWAAKNLHHEPNSYEAVNLGFELERIDALTAQLALADKLAAVGDEILDNAVTLEHVDTTVKYALEQALDAYRKSREGK